MKWLALTTSKLLTPFKAEKKREAEQLAKKIEVLATEQLSALEKVKSCPQLPHWKGQISDEFSY